MKNSVELDRALKKKPKTLDDLSLLLGGGVASQKFVMSYHSENILKIKSVNIDVRMISALLLIIIAQIFPYSFIRSILSLLALLIIPYYWTKNLLQHFEINPNLTVGLVIAELMFESLILGYLGILNRNIIFVVLLISLLSKYLVLKFK